MQSNAENLSFPNDNAPLIKVEQQNGRQVVSARELYGFLGYNMAVWSRWYPKNIVSNPYAIENEDWVGFNIMLNGNETQDFALSLDFAKRLAMRAQTDKGEQARRYFLECEKQLQRTTSLSHQLTSRVQQAVAQDRQEAEILEEVLALQEKVALLEASQIKEDSLSVLPVSSLGVQRAHMIVREYYAYRKRAYTLTRSELFTLGDKLRKASLLAHQEMFYVVPDGERHPVRAFHVSVLKSVLNF